MDHRHLIEYYPPVLKTSGKDWYVHFSVRHPTTRRMMRQRIRLNHAGGAGQRRALGRSLVMRISSKLERGWNPFLEGDTGLQLTSIEKAIAHFINYKTQQGRRPQTILTLTSRTNHFVKWIQRKEGDIAISQVTPRLAQAYIDSLLLDKKKRRSPRTMNNIMMDMAGVFNFFKRKHYINYNPFSELELLQVDEKKREPLTMGQAKAFFEWCWKNDQRMYYLAGYCFYCAIRPTEMTRIKISDVNFSKGFIEVPAAAAKTRRKRYAALLGKKFPERLEAYLARYPMHYVLAGPGLIPAKNSGPRYADQIQKRFAVIAEKLSFCDGVTFYSLKDTIGCLLLDNGATLKDIQALFGHTRASTSEIYILKYRPQINGRLLELAPDF